MPGGKASAFIDCSPDAGHTYTQTDRQTYAFAKINLLCSVLKSCISDSSIKWPYLGNGEKWGQGYY